MVELSRPFTVRGGAPFFGLKTVFTPKKGTQVTEGRLPFVCLSCLVLGINNLVSLAQYFERICRKLEMSC